MKEVVSSCYILPGSHSSEPWKLKPWTLNLIPTATAGLDLPPLLSHTIDHVFIKTLTLFTAVCKFNLTQDK